MLLVCQCYCIFMVFIFHYTVVEMHHLRFDVIKNNLKNMLMSMSHQRFIHLVGLRLLLSPIGSNVVVRTACCSVGIILPVYSTFKAIETENQNEQKKWLMYWAAYGSFSIAEVFTDKFISWFPLYYHMKFAFLVWLQLPTVDGSKQLYNNCLRPFLLRHQARLDQIVGTVYCEMAKFVSAHRAEIQFARTVFTKISVSANHFVCDIFHPARRGENGASEGPRHEQTHASRAIEGPTTEELSSGSEIDE